MRLSLHHVYQPIYITDCSFFGSKAIEIPEGLCSNLYPKVTYPMVTRKLVQSLLIHVTSNLPISSRMILYMLF